MGSAPSTSAIYIQNMFRSECSFEQSCHSLSFDFWGFFCFVLFCFFFAFLFVFLFHSISTNISRSEHMGSAPSTSAICIQNMFRSECSFEQSCHSLSFDFFFYFFFWGGGVLYHNISTNTSRSEH